MQIIDISPPNLLFPMAVNGNSSFQLLRPNSRVILDVSIFFLSHSIQQQILLSSSSKFTKNTTNSNYTTFTTLVIFHRLYLFNSLLSGSPCLFSCSLQLIFSTVVLVFRLKHLSVLIIPRKSFHLSQVKS